ncbi:MAG: ankyrin repeat domain-containing protein [Alphaproteobacteria bacterium]|nr:ankyrin repeat domain-containing protein [Alphaproteobacteria bacterium]
MKKSAIVLSGVLVVAAAAGGVFMMNGGSSGAAVSVYWDEKTPLNEGDELALVKALKAKDVKAVEALLEKGADIEAKGKDGVSALALVLSAGDEAMFALLEQGKTVDFNKPEYMTAAIDGGQAALVQALLEKGADVNGVLEFKGKHRPDETAGYQDARIMTPLKKAVFENKAEIVKVLLDNGADGADYFLTERLTTADIATLEALAQKVGKLRELSVKGTDLLSYAASAAKPEVIAFLLKYNAGDVNEALMRLLTYRDKDNDYAKAAEMFLRAGAVPADEALEMMLKQQNTVVFDELQKCRTTLEGKTKDGEKTLFSYALELNDVKAVKRFLERGADIWAKDKDGVTAIYKALLKADAEPEIFELFTDKIKDVNEGGYDGETLLMMYAKKGDYERYKQTLDKGGDVWQKDNSGRTVLMYAALGGNLKIINYQLYKGDNLNAVDDEGKTVLMYAAESGQTEAFNHLVEKGADISALDDEGRSALMIAAGKGRADIAEILINKGESPAATDKNGKSVLMYAAESGDVKMVGVLFDRGIEANESDKGGVSTLSYASQSRNADVVDLVLRHGGDIFAMDKKGYFPAVYAAMNGDKDILDKVWPNGGVVRDYTLDNGRTLLMYALDGGNYDLLNFVLSRKRDLINKKDNQGVSFVMELAQKGRPEILRQVVSLNGSVTARDNAGKSVLMYAAEGEAGVNLVTILQKGGDVLIKDKEGKTALMYAVGGRYNLAVKQHLLLERGSDVNAADKKGKSVLMYAVGNPLAKVSTSLIEELISYQADVALKDENGKTALMYAVENLRAEMGVVETLLSAGADINAVDNNGLSVLAYALKGNDIGKVRLLLEKGADKALVQSHLDELLKGSNPCFAKAVKELFQGA